MATRILIIEDDFGLADNLKALLQVKGFEVESAADGVQGVEAARKFLPNVVLLDIMIPKLSGFDVCRTLRTDPKTQHIRIIMMTGLSQMQDIEKAFSCGAVDYLTKPFESDRLIRKIEKALAKP
ncbi:MAG: response regulator [Elusimicrobiota bacterium]